MPQTPRATVLVVENDAPIRALTEAILELARFEVHTVASIDEGRAILASVVPDVAVVDLELPGHDTRDAIAALRSSEHEGTIVIGIAGADQQVDATFVDALLRKPTAVATLASVVATVIADPDAVEDPPLARVGDRIFARDDGPSLGIVRGVGARHLVASVRGEDVVLPRAAIAAVRDGKLVIDLSRVDPGVRRMIG